MNGHARLSPSGAEGWMACTQWASDPVGSIYADRGTAMHELAARVLAEPMLTSHDFLGETLTANNREFQVDAEMVETVHVYTEYVRGFDLTHDLLTEVRVPIGHVTGEENASGTADALLFSRDGTELVVVDLKTGRGVEVEAERNPQLMMYALGALEFARLIAYTPATVRLVISQPRISRVPSEWTCTLDDLNEFHLQVQAAAARYGKGDATPGEKQCRWCARKATCATLAGRVQDEIGAEFEDLTTSDKGKQDEILQNLIAKTYLPGALDAVGLIEDWCAAIRAEAERRLREGEPVPGYKLVLGKRGQRAWSDAKAAEELLRKRFRLTVEQAYDLKLISPTAAEKVLKDQPKRWAQVLPLISQPEGKPTVAPIHDKRPAIEIKPIAEQFDDHTGADLA